MKSFLSYLECTGCGAQHMADRPQNVCPDCGKVLYPRYDLEGVRRAVSPQDLARRPNTMWRFFEVLPVRDPERVVTLGEGETPLLPAPRLGKALGCTRLYIKEEGVNPTGSFKARGLSAAVSRAAELGLRRLSVPSAGNAGGALAAYAARAGVEAHVFMPQETPDANKVECLAYGAKVTLVPGSIRDAGRVAREEGAKEGLFDLSTLQEPYRLEGKKTMGYELAQALGWRAPDVLVYPTGGGTGILGIWKAFQEMEALGWLAEEKRPAMVCVQAEGCAPLVQALHDGKERCDPWPDPRSIAAGLRVPSPFADYLILQTIRESGGTAVSVSDDEMRAGVWEMAALEGVFPCPEGAATLAGLRKLLASGAVDPESSIVLLNTGTGLKYLDVLGEPATG